MKPPICILCGRPRNSAVAGPRRPCACPLRKPPAHSMLARVRRRAWIVPAVAVVILMSAVVVLIVATLIEP